MPFLTPQEKEGLKEVVAGVATLLFLFVVGVLALAVFG